MVQVFLYNNVYASVYVWGVYVNSNDIDHINSEQTPIQSLSA